jgi:hypothetical protein
MFLVALFQLLFLSPAEHVCVSTAFSGHTAKEAQEALDLKPCLPGKVLGKSFLYILIHLAHIVLFSNGSIITKVNL